MLELRRPAPDDAGHYTALFGDTSVGRKLWPGVLGGPRTPEEAAALLEHDLEHWDRDGFGPWVGFAEGAFAARGGLERTGVGGAPSVEVLYAVMPAAQGAGLATELATAAVAEARRLGLPEVVGFAWTENPASIRVLEKAGLEFERVIEHAGLPHWFGRLQLGERASATPTAAIQAR